MKYIIVRARSRSKLDVLNELQKKVNEYLKNGYVLQGGISTYATYSAYHEEHFADQAMVKYPPNTTINIE